MSIQLASVAALAMEFSPDLDWLSDSERDRLALITSGQRSRQFLAGHWLLRRLTEEVFGGDVRDWSLMACGDHAPVLKSRQHGQIAYVHGSLSHCGDLVAAAVATFPIGVDVERPSKPRNLLAIAETTFSRQECADLRRLHGSELAAAFYLYWTLKEAAGKREGHGLRPELARQQVPLECAADDAEIVSWQFGDCSLALAGAVGTPIRAAGIPEGASARYWRILSAVA